MLKVHAIRGADFVILHSTCSVYVSFQSTPDGPKKKEAIMVFDITWKGASHKSYTFTAYPDGQQFNPVSGVYIFCRPLSSGNWEALYVGETQSLYDRLNVGISGHDGYARAKKLGMTHIAAMSVVGDTNRLGVETDLRHGLKPSANAQGVSSGVR